MKNFRILRPVENKLKISEYKSSMMKGTDLVPSIMRALTLQQIHVDRRKQKIPIIKNLLL